ncbi:type VI secretion system-associated protein VasI [Utexia brackfieldae]|uniref:type VI secretion system-associated protein VasI n=1 Tax=Utexia brackfieldae TaxID=3074108 RepID=UPI00370D9C46
MLRQKMPINWRVSALLLLLAAWWVHADDSWRQAYLQCQNERSALIRLDCYDSIIKATPEPAPLPDTYHQDIAKVLIQEQQRPANSTEFILTQADGEISPQVILTTPALGTRSPRPVLALSCLDNITRMQIIVNTPLPSSASNLILKTDTGSRLESHWFIRDQGLVLENSRGLPGIAQIQKLFQAKAVLIESDSPLLNGLSFNIYQLEKAIVPLRQACHW